MIWNEMKISRTRRGGTATPIASNVGSAWIRSSVFRWTILLKSIFGHEWKINPPQLFTKQQPVWISGSASANWPWPTWFKSGVSEYSNPITNETKQVNTPKTLAQKRYKFVKKWLRQTWVISTWLREPWMPKKIGESVESSNSRVWWSIFCT